MRAGASCRAWESRSTRRCPGCRRRSRGGPAVRAAARARSSRSRPPECPRSAGAAAPPPAPRNGGPRRRTYPLVGSRAYPGAVQPLFEHRLELAGFETRALELEGEGPPLLLLHGWADSADTWRLLLDRLGRDDRRAVALDMPGFGTAPPPSPDEPL